jgi:hypothetical protein
MVDRVEIDALLVGALYGELSPAESSRLEAHLSAHPHDRMALEGLTRARQAVRDSRFLALLAEPPPAISAMLLQEAARRAPKRAEAGSGFFARIVAGFSMMSRHPAMASLAIIVVVVGVAGALYLRGKDSKVAEPTAPAAPVLTPPETAAAGSGYAADYHYDEQKQTADGKAENGAQVAQGDSDEYADDDNLKREPAKPSKETAPSKKKPKVRGVEVSSTPELQLKDLEQEEGGKKQAQDPSTTPMPDVVAGQTRFDLGAGGSTAAPPPAEPTPSTPSTDASKADRDARSTTGKTAGNKAPTSKPADTKPAKPDPTEVARNQHRRMVGYVKANKCTDAGKVGALIADQYPDYFAEHVANDRNVKACKPYVESERKKKSEQRAKSRPQNYDAAESDMSPPNPSK